jgi:GNAT superfamily N-acetyltransferase
MSVTIRSAEANDKARCLELLALLGRTAGGSIDERAPEVFDLLLDKGRGQVLVADEGGALLGLAAFSYNVAMRYGGEYCQLEELIVDPNARGKKVGVLLVEAMLERASERGCSECGLYLLESTEQNRPFYEKCGFEHVGSELRRIL